MDKEYLMAAPSQQIFHLDSRFDHRITDQKQRYLVSDIPGANADIYAPEIHFYKEFSKDSHESKQTNIITLYEARSIALDLSQNIDFSTYIGNRVAIITVTGEPLLEPALQEFDFSSLHISWNLVSSVTGQIGELKITCLIDGEETVLYTDQILWQNMPETYINTSGIYDLASLEDPIKQLSNNRGNLQYTNSIKYVSASCLHHHKREDICHKCVDICPTNALSIDNKEIEISHIHCNECGACVGTCPSGSLDFAPLPRKCFSAIASLYRQKIALISSDIDSLHEYKLPLNKGILPLVVPTTRFLDENHLLTLLQETGYGVIIHAPDKSPILESITQFLNDIFQRKFGIKAVHLCESAKEIEEVSQSIARFAAPLETSIVNSISKRQDFTQRLSLLIGSDELGSIHSGPYLNYGNMSINQDRCSLCLSCADACNTGALSVHSEDNSLRYNAALCTQCGYCQKTCPEEDCLQLQGKTLTLSKSYFTEKIMAQDQLFACIECGIKFAPQKAVAKVIDTMTPIFAQDSLKIKSLSCCSNCKARLMLEVVTAE